MKPINCGKTIVNKGFMKKEKKKTINRIESYNPARKLHIIIVLCTYV